ncbi:ArsR/SmtB family transcription factor [Calorimonas adulescens]|jgi:transcriptional regulator, ArsR family|uniref:Winged helix-turn-helix transcriptional regulator n=1 Tax=Calorimonas adulescens TaxID=2606906 RepID=A0A5D8QFI0_9THEO|nr:metalloregulator ArsR/SmtB family transcription factor [Calorimonas adulescens]TZE82283.1 winged helix-turn-helix transcriptional regulator [Calorimonas adulescens]
MDKYELRAEVIKALSHPARLKIIDILSSCNEKCVCEIMEELGLEQSTVSKHLSILKSVGIIDSRKDGLKVLYHLNAPCMVSFFGCIDNILSRDIERRMYQLERG